MIMVANEDLHDQGRWGQTIQERRQHIADMARCRGCDTDQKSCNADRRGREGPEGLCCWGGIPGHGHVENPRMVDELMREIMAGEVRTVAEAYPPPVQGPKLPGYAWLLDQKEWWYPHRRPAVLIASMDKPWRWNTVRFLERKASGLHADVGSRYMHDAPDDVWASWQAESPLEWLREQPLMRALSKGLPPVGSAKGRALALRAIHWNTCPMRLAHPGASGRCRCIRDGSGRIIGATNDPASAVTA